MDDAAANAAITKAGCCFVVRSLGAVDRLPVDPAPHADVEDAAMQANQLLKLARVRLLGVSLQSGLFTNCSMLKYDC